jgi:ParB-like chromosome segregation protein Spo0J
MLDIGQQTPILVRADGARFVLVEGLHRLEAAKALKPSSASAWKRANSERLVVVLAGAAAALT